MQEKLYTGYRPGEVLRVHPEVSAKAQKELIRLAVPVSKSMYKNRREKLRSALYQAQGCRCIWCGERMFIGKYAAASPKYASFEHLVELKDGGGWGADNLRLACVKCNNSRGIARGCVASLEAKYTRSPMFRLKTKVWLCLSKLWF